MKIGVRLSAHFTDAGDYLADARALDAAGVDSLWLPDDGLDPWLVLAGIAAVTGRARLAVPISARDGVSPDALARRLATLDRLSRGRVLMTLVPAGEPAETEVLIARARRGSRGHCCSTPTVAVTRWSGPGWRTGWWPRSIPRAATPRSIRRGSGASATG